VSIVLLIRTDQERAEIALGKKLVITDNCKWLAGRELSATLNHKIEELLQKNNIEFKDLGGLVFYSGPGSFTGLRIGVSVANTLAYSLHIPIVGSVGESWQKNGLTRIINNENDKIVKLHYGSEPNITKSRK